MSELTLSKLCKAYGFRGTTAASNIIGVSRRTLERWFNDSYDREYVLKPALSKGHERLIARQKIQDQI